MDSGFLTYLLGIWAMTLPGTSFPVCRVEIIKTFTRGDSCSLFSKVLPLLKGLTKSEGCFCPDLTLASFRHGRISVVIFPLSYSSGTSSSFFTGAASVPQFPSLGSAVGKGASGLLPQSRKIGFAIFQQNPLSLGIGWEAGTASGECRAGAPATVP